MTRSLIALLIFLGLLGCEKEQKGSKRKVFKATPPEIAGHSSRGSKKVYPFDRIITDKKQRKVEAVVVGRTRTEIIFQDKNSKTPNKQHRYLISELASADQEFFMSMPRHQWEGRGGVIVQSLLRERKRITELITDKQKEKLRTPDAKTRIRALDREIGRLEKMLDENDLKIKSQRDREARGN
jgi:hypothetical protein